MLWFVVSLIASVHLLGPLIKKCNLINISKYHIFIHFISITDFKMDEQVQIVNHRFITAVKYNFTITVSIGMYIVTRKYYF